MGASCSQPRPRRDRLVGDLDESAHNYGGDQSYLNYSENQHFAIYNSEFSPPESQRVQLRAGRTVKEKLENIRQSWFNPNSFEEKVFYDPAKKEPEVKVTVKDKLTTWRRSWFGPEQDAQVNTRKSSVIDVARKTDTTEGQGGVVRRENRGKLSQSGANRLSVTRSFVQRLSQTDSVYGKTSTTGTPATVRKSVSRESSEGDSHDSSVLSPAQEVEERLSDVDKYVPVQPSLHEIEEAEANDHNNDEKEEATSDEEHEDAKNTDISDVRVGMEESKDDTEDDKEDDYKEEDETEEVSSEEDDDANLTAVRAGVVEDEEEKIATRSQKPYKADDSPLLKRYERKHSPIYDRPRVRIGAGSYKTYSKVKVEKADNDFEQKKKSTKRQESYSDSD